MFYDAFLFSCELDLLELRLWETEDVVDRWVLVESERTHSGLKKPLFYHDNKDRFARWNSRIHHHVASLDGNTNDERENGHRRELGNVLRSLHVEDEDIIHTSDLDEIPAEQALRNWKPEMGISGIEAPHSYYYLNAQQGGWGAGRIGTWGQIARETGGDFQKLRHIGRDLPMLKADQSIPLSGGWHLSFMGGVRTIQQKLAWYLHSDAYQRHIIDPRWLRHCIGTGTNLFYALNGRDDLGTDFFRFVEPAILPKAIDKFPVMLARGVRFAYQRTPAQLRDLWRTVCSRQLTEGAILDVGATDGMETITIASAILPQSVIVVRDASSLNEFFFNNVAMLTEGNFNSSCDSLDDFWSRWHGPIQFCHLNDNPGEINSVLKFLVPGGTVCGHGWVDAISVILPGAIVSGDFWRWQKPS